MKIIKAIKSGLKLYRKLSKEEMVDKEFMSIKYNKDDTCGWHNGDYYVQRTEKEYNSLISKIMYCIKKYEPWIYGEYKNNEKGDCFKPEYIKGYSMMGRYLDDGSSPIYKWWSKQGNICPKCFREYGQMYYALNCKCENTDIPKGEGK